METCPEHSEIYSLLWSQNFDHNISKIRSYSTRASKRYPNNKSHIDGRDTALTFRFSAENFESDLKPISAGLFWLFTRCFNKMHPILLLNFEKPRALMPLCIVSYKFQILLVLFDTSHDDFQCLEAESQPFS